MPYLVHPYILTNVMLRAEQFCVDPETILGIIAAESGFDPWAIGDSGHSVGLGQLHDQGAGTGMSVAERMDVSRNIEVLTQYLVNCYQATLNWDDAFSAYNQGIAGWRAKGAAVNRFYVATVRSWIVRFSIRGFDPDPNSGLIQFVES